MKDTIIKKIKEIEKTENVKVLYCIESGSRAWGFASPDSDYDVRFIYIRPMEYYLSFDKKRDVIEYELNDVYDISGWDIAKALPLLHSSNPTLFEWIQSPIVYYTSKEWEKVVSISDKYFSKKSALYHYLNTAKTNIKVYLSKVPLKLKKYFYVLRPLLCCKWIMEYNEKPPMLFSTLCEKYLEGDIKTAVNKLVEIKVNSNETAYGEHIEIIDRYIESEIENTQNYLNNIEKEKSSTYEELNRIFIDLLKNADFD